MKTKHTFTTIGLGKVGKTFTRIFKEVFHLNIDYLVDQREQGEFLEHQVLDVLPRRIDSDIILITTPDDTIWETVRLLNSKHVIKKDALFIHCSGALYLQDERVLSIHPMMSITKDIKDLYSLQEHYFTLQSDNKEHLEWLLPQMQKVSKKLQVIQGKDKPYYHLASVMINNFSTILMHASQEVLQKTGLDAKNAMQMLLPLFKDVFLNMNGNALALDSLTGPIKRGDKQTIDKHLQLLEGTEEREIYQAFLAYMGNQPLNEL